MTKELIEEARDRTAHMKLLAKVTENSPGAVRALEEADRMTRFADALEAALAARQPTEDDREAVANLLNEVHDPCVTEGGCNFSGWTSGYMTGSEVSDVVDELIARWPRASAPDAATELAAIKARADEVGEDEGWHIGGAWGDYGEVVVPLRILSYVVDGALDEKVVSTDPGYAATYAEQVARADRAGAERDAANEYAFFARQTLAEVEEERDAALAAVERVKVILERDDFGDDWEHDEWVYREAAEKKLEEIETALDGAPEPEVKP